MSPEPSSEVPLASDWPLGRRTDVPISKDRIWIDGCFDFSHHGHAGAMLQARRLGGELVVGIHSDQEIEDNKGPTVMTLRERISAVSACRWMTNVVPNAPYVTSLPWITHYGCHYVVHGDDITSDSSGEDCYRFVKAAGRFLVVKRTPGISTTDLVGRMLLCTKLHFIKSLHRVLSGEEGAGSLEERRRLGEEMTQRIRDYATDETGLQSGPRVLSWTPSPSSNISDVEVQDQYIPMVAGKGPQPGQRIVYVDGGFDLFSSGHIEFLRQVTLAEQGLGRKRDWYTESSINCRISHSGEDYPPAHIVAGVHDDEVVNRHKGINYPIMNIFERGLCVIQCRYIHALIFSAPFVPTLSFLKSLPFGTPDAVYHGPTSPTSLNNVDPYAAAKQMGVYQEIESHEFQNVNAEEIVGRILKSRERYEERQRKKETKAAGEEEVKRREGG